MGGILYYEKENNRSVFDPMYYDGKLSSLWDKR